MFIIETKDYKEISKRAAEFIIDEVNKTPNIVLGLPTGDTPLGMYQNLVIANKKKMVDFSRVRTFNLDEYYPFQKKNQNSYHNYMLKNFIEKINIKKDNTNLLDPETKNPNKECKNYELKIKRNPIDLMILGVGVNGHIGFNEPKTSIKSMTRLVNLSNSTRKMNSRFFKNTEFVPYQALTMGLDTILRSKRIIVLASGKNKASAIKMLMSGKIDSNWPITALKNHKHLIVIVDKEASSELK